MVVVPAKRLVPETPSELTYGFVKPLSNGIQLEPLSVERKTPPPLVAANRSDPLARISITVLLKGPLERVQSASDLVVRKASAPTAAQTSKTDFFIRFL